MINETIQLYDNRPDVTLTSYVLYDSPELLGGKKRPAVLVCPGGGYMNCSDREAEPVALRFASMGYHAFVLRYSTYFRGENMMINPEEEMELNPDSVYPAPMRDIGKAFLYIHSMADKWLVDTSKIALCGFSAGAHNSAMYSVYWNDPVIHEHFNESPGLFRPAAAILGYGIYDYHLMANTDFDEIDPFAGVLRKAASIAFFGTAEPDEKMLDIASPSKHVGPDTPPCFIWATTEDTLVPVQNSCVMAAALSAAGIPFEVHIYEKGPHGLSLGTQATAGSLFETNAASSQWVQAVEKWLEYRFALPLKEKPFWMEEAEKSAPK